MWVKIKPPWDRRFLSLVPFTRVPFWVPIFDPQPNLAPPLLRLQLLLLEDPLVGHFRKVSQGNCSFGKRVDVATVPIDPTITRAFVKEMLLC